MAGQGASSALHQDLCDLKALLEEERDASAMRPRRYESSARPAWSAGGSSS
jgi:hypothetical protein